MNRTLLVRTVVRRLTRHKGRSLAMGVGIALGVAVTVLLQSASAQVRGKFRAYLDTAYPPDGIVVFAGGGPMSGGGGPARLTIEDLETIAAATGATRWDPMVFAGPREVRREGVTVRVPLSGVSDRSPDVRRRGALAGRFFDDGHVRTRAAVALIGATTAERLFGAESPVGGEVFVDGIAFEVLGVLERRGADPHGGDQDDAMVIPYTTLHDRMVRSRNVSAVTFRLDEPSRVAATAREIEALLRREHGIGEGQEDDFSLFTAERMQAMFRRSFRTFDLFVPLISLTVFLVSALVILAVAQLGIRARRHEIGLRKAVGARSRDVERQIVLEVLAVAGAASLAGIALAPAALAALAPLLAERFGVRELSIAALPVALAVAGAVLTGLLGSILPARRAARLDPVTSLR